MFYHMPQLRLMILTFQKRVKMTFKLTSSCKLTVQCLTSQYLYQCHFLVSLIWLTRFFLMFDKPFYRKISLNYTSILKKKKRKWNELDKVFIFYSCQNVSFWLASCPVWNTYICYMRFIQSIVICVCDSTWWRYFACVTSVAVFKMAH